MQSLKVILIIGLLALFAASCAARKKRKCNTCPKWTEIPADQRVAPNEIG